MTDTEVTLEERITQYLSVGGLWNPEAMEHDKVRTLLMDCRDYLQRIRKAERPEPVAWYIDLYGPTDAYFNEREARREFQRRQEKRPEYAADRKLIKLYGPDLLDYADRMAGYANEWHQCVMTAATIAEIDGLDTPKTFLTQLREKLDRMAAERDAVACHHGWRGTKPNDGERIATPCPACGCQSLFIGSGGHLICARVPSDTGDGCPSPSVQDTVKAISERAESAEAKLARVEKLLREPTEEMVDKALSAIIPGGSTFEAWMLPYANERGRRNIRDAIKCAFKAMTAAIGGDALNELEGKE